MANHKKQYFLAPTWDNPPDKAISLGNIIISPKKPIPSYIPVTPQTAPDASSLQKCQKRTVTWTKEKARSGMFGVYTKFLQLIVGVGVDADVDVTVKDGRTFEFETMDTAEFFPTDEYLRVRLADAKLKSYLATKWSKKFYIINGIKVVHGAKAKSDKSKDVKTTVDVGADGTLLAQVPGEAGVKIAPGVQSAETHSFGSSDDFVFAFSVLRVTVKEDQTTTKIETSGALYGQGEEDDVQRTFAIENIGTFGDEVLDEDEQIMVAEPSSFKENTGTS